MGHFDILPKWLVDYPLSTSIAKSDDKSSIKIEHIGEKIYQCITDLIGRPNIALPKEKEANFWSVTYWQIGEPYAIQCIDELFGNGIMSTNFSHCGNSIIRFLNSPNAI